MLLHKEKKFFMFLYIYFNSIKKLDLKNVFYLFVVWGKKDFFFPLGKVKFAILWGLKKLILNGSMQAVLL